MKRAILASILGIAATLATVASSPGQGNIIWSNYAGNNTTQITWGPWHPLGYNTGDPVSDTSMILNLYAGAGALTDSSALQLLATAAIFTTTSYGGGWYDAAGVLIPTTMWSPGRTVTFQIRASGIPIGFVRAASPLWQERASIVSISLPPNFMENGPLPIYWSPEPSTVSLVILGTATFYFLRRRK